MAFRSRTRREVAQLLHYDLPPGQPSGQDRLVADVDTQFFAVADGVGGSSDGALAAEAACEAFVKYAPSFRLGIQAVLEALPEVYSELHRAVKETGSVTTFTGSVVTDDGYVAWLHAGDSRLFYLPASGDLYELTQPQHDPNARHQLLNALGGDHDRLTLRPNSTHSHLPIWGFERLSEGDRLVFATDGLGPIGFDGMNDEYQWWMESAVRSVGQTAVATVNKIFSASHIIDDGTIVIADIEA